MKRLALLGALLLAGCVYVMPMGIFYKYFEGVEGATKQSAEHLARLKTMVSGAQAASTTPQDPLYIELTNDLKTADVKLKALQAQDQALKVLRKKVDTYGVKKSEYRSSDAEYPALNALFEELKAKAPQVQAAGNDFTDTVNAISHKAEQRGLHVIELTPARRKEMSDKLAEAKVSLGKFNDEVAKARKNFLAGKKDKLAAMQDMCTRLNNKVTEIQTSWDSFDKATAGKTMFYQGPGHTQFALFQNLQNKVNEYGTLGKQLQDAIQAYNN